MAFAHSPASVGFRRRLALLLAAVVVALALGVGAARADEPRGPYWYRVYINHPASGASFVGTSIYNPEQLATLIASKGQMIRLENIRALQNRGNGFTWEPDQEVRNVFIVPESVTYFYELVGDPLTKPDRSVP